MDAERVTALESGGHASWIVSGTIHGELKLWRLGCSQQLDCHPNAERTAVTAFAFLEPSMVISGTADGSCKVWQILEHRLVPRQQLDTGSGPITKLAAYMDPNIPWSALAAQMDMAPWQDPPQGQLPPTQAALASRPGVLLGLAALQPDRQREWEGHGTSGNGPKLVKIFVAAGSAHGLVHVWQALGWGSSMWQRVAIKGQVADAPIEGLSFMADGSMLAAIGGSLGGVWAWDSSTWEGCWQPGGPAIAFEFLGPDWAEALSRPHLLICPKSAPFVPFLLPVPRSQAGHHTLQEQRAAIPRPAGQADIGAYAEGQDTFAANQAPKTSLHLPFQASSDPTQEAPQSQACLPLLQPILPNFLPVKHLNGDRAVADTAEHTNPPGPSHEAQCYTDRTAQGSRTDKASSQGVDVPAADFKPRAASSGLAVPHLNSSVHLAQQLSRLEMAEFHGPTAIVQAAGKAAGVRKQAAATAVDVPRHVQQYAALQTVSQNVSSEAGLSTMRRKVGKQLAPQWVASRAAKPQLSDMWRANEQVASVLDTRPLPAMPRATRRSVAKRIADQILRDAR
ncbi:hypothetical protein WJX74_005678 [Apatococcus lobatus]|uniref:Uncharacterized protein n=1 Tax=Apatococcus lobatus TaxID=904363 RepID=A0AAW1S6U6_9CHLO